MNTHIKKVYVPMTETAFYILLCLRKPNHGYGIVQNSLCASGSTINTKTAENSPSEPAPGGHIKNGTFSILFS